MLTENEDSRPPAQGVMKICPECQTRYANDVATCAADGEELVELPEELSGNPKLKEPVPTGTADRTSMIDLEAIEAKRKKKDPEAAEGEGLDDEKTPPPEEPIEADRDATGTLQRKQKKKKKEPTQVAAAGDAGDNGDDDVSDIPADRRVNEELTDREMSRTGKSARKERSNAGTKTGMTRTKQRVPEAPKRRVSATQAAVLVMVGVIAMIAGIVTVARATAVLTVTTVPPGASVTLDGLALGLAPLQKRVRTGSHAVELSLDGYESYKEVVDVPAGGLPFLQPLQRKPPPPPPPPTSAEIAADMARAAGQMFDAGDYDGTRRKAAEALKLSSSCAECAAMLAKAEAAIAKRDGDRAKEEAQGAREQRLRNARVLAEEGKRLYESNQLGPAKQKLYASLKLDTENPEPHRTLGRIFNREDDVDKVRYHLQRYLDLGGADGDFKVREWLKSHPK